MNAVQWGSAVLFAIWGLAHVAFGIFTVLPAAKNQLFAVFKGVVGGHPQLSAIEEAFKPLEAAPRGLNALFVQHGLNVFKPGVIACTLAFWLMAANDQYPFVALALTIDIFFDHNFYGVAVDWKGYAEPVASAMLYIANTAVILSIYDLAVTKEIVPLAWAYVFIPAAGLMMFITTLIHVLRCCCKPTEAEMSRVEVV